MLQDRTGSFAHNLLSSNILLQVVYMHKLYLCQRKWQIAIFFYPKNHFPIRIYVRIIIHVLDVETTVNSKQVFIPNWQC